MKKTISISIAMITISISVLAQTNTYWNAENLKSSQACLLKIVRGQMNSQKTSLPPTLKIESETPLIEFQDAMEKWWNMRPDFFLNVYDAPNNTIYLMNAINSYKNERTPFDSLVHELAHFVQVQDQGMELKEDEWAESEAVRVQTWFRDNYGKHIKDQTYLGPCE